MASRTDRRPGIRAVLLVVLTVSAVSVVSTQDGPLINHNEKSVRGLAKAYGFLIGQDSTLREIARRYPTMTAEAQLARLTFDAAFPGLLPAIERELTIVVGAEKLPALREQMLKALDDLRQPLDPTAAAEFLQQVRDRSRGEGVETDVLSYLLAIRYSRQPVSEYVDGFRERYQTDGTGKAQGVKLVLQLPRSWLAQDGERPHIVQKWTNEGGTGLSVITLDIRDLGGPAPTVQEVDELIRSGEMRREFAALGTVLDLGRFTVERQPGVRLELSTLQERVGPLYSRGVLYQVYFRGKAVGLMCMASRPESERSRADDASKLLEPLCRQVANSLVLIQLY